MSTNKHVYDDLSAYLDRELSAGDTRRVEAHLRTCAECRRELESLRYTIQMVQALPTVRAPRSFTLSDAQAARVRPRSAGGWLVNVLRGMTVVATVLLFAICGIDFATLSRGGTAAAPAPAVFSTQNQSTAQDNASPATETSKASGTAASAPASGQQPVPPAAATVASSGAGGQVNQPTTAPLPLLVSASPTSATTTGAALPPVAPQITAAAVAPQNTPTANPTPIGPSVASANSPTPNATTDIARSSVVPTATATTVPTARPTGTATATALPPTATPKPTIAPPATATPVIVVQAQPPPPAPTIAPAAREAYTDLLPPQRIAEIVLIGVIALGGIALFTLRMFSR